MLDRLQSSAACMRRADSRGPAVRRRAAVPRRYDIYLFSRPDTLLAWASLPVVKVMQIRYVLDGLKAVDKAVQA